MEYKLTEAEANIYKKKKRKKKRKNKNLYKKKNAANSY